MARRRTRKKVNRRAGARRKSNGTPAWMLLLGGIIIGLAISLVILFRGSFADLKDLLSRPDKPVAVQPETNLADEPELTPKKEPKPRYDFFTVLPEMEVIVPEQELTQRAQPEQEISSSTDAGNYVLQVGSFRSVAEAEQMKARLALIGILANVQSVTINDSEWHRVRVGPVSGARKADEMRRHLQDNQFDTLVMKASP